MKAWKRDYFSRRIAQNSIEIVIAAPYVELNKIVPSSHGKIEAEVIVSDEGRYFYKYRGGFLEQYHASRSLINKETKIKSRSKARILIEILLLAGATYGALLPLFIHPSFLKGCLKVKGESKESILMSKSSRGLSNEFENKTD